MAKLGFKTINKKNIEEQIHELEKEVRQLLKRKNELIKMAEKKRILDMARSIGDGKYGDLNIEKDSRHVIVKWKGQVVFYVTDHMVPGELEIKIYRASKEWENAMEKTLEEELKRRHLISLQETIKELKRDFIDLDKKEE